MTQTSKMPIGSIYLAMGILFYVASWKTQNMEYVTIANLAMTLFAASIIADILVAIITSVRSHNE